MARRAPEGFDKVFFTNAGADANENAMRAARLFTGRDKILSSYRCYHGNTGAAISATGDWRRKPNDYSRGHVHFFTRTCIAPSSPQPPRKRSASVRWLTSST